MLYTVIGDGIEIWNPASETPASGATPGTGEENPASPAPVRGGGQPAAHGGIQAEASGQAGQHRGQKRGIRQR
jgi:hypothetical protein